MNAELDLLKDSVSSVEFCKFNKFDKDNDRKDNSTGP
jgi:hypothetical protein